MRWIALRDVAAGDAGRNRSRIAKNKPDSAEFGRGCVEVIGIELTRNKSRNILLLPVGDFILRVADFRECKNYGIFRMLVGI